MNLESTIYKSQKRQVLLLDSQISKLKITERDLSILDFLLNMKFAGFEEIYEKLFPQTDNLYWGYSHWSRDRLAKLRNHGLVESFQFPGSQRRYFLATEKGRRTLLRIDFGL
jgi:Fe2+ or Zn2+ uptake regulation protein